MSWDSDALRTPATAYAQTLAAITCDDPNLKQAKFKEVRKLTVPFAIFLLIIGPSSCILFNERCPDTLDYFKINGLDIYNLTFTGEGFNPWRKLDKNEIVSWDKYFMRIEFKKTFHADNAHFAGGANLYATSCQQNGEAGSKIGVDTLFVVSLNDFNSDYFANDTLNNIISVNYKTYSVSDFNTFFPLARYINENEGRIFEETFEIKINQRPMKSSGDYQFKIVFILKNGEVFEQTGDKVKITL